MRRLSFLVVALALAGGLWVAWQAGWGTRPPAGDGGLGSQPQTRLLAARQAAPEPTRLALTRVNSQPPWLSGGACAGEAPPDLVRPATAAVVNATLDELADRSRALLRSGEHSEQLGQGLRLALGESSTEAEARRGMELLFEAPDRRVDGFDVAAATAISVGLDRLHAIPHGSAEQIAARVIEAAPESVAGFLFAAYVADARGANADALRHLERAHALAPDEPSVALEVGMRLGHTPQVERARAALEVYLQTFPEDGVVEDLAARMTTRADLQRGFAAMGLDGLGLLYPPGLEQPAAEVLVSLRQALDEAARRTGTAPRTELTAVIYETRADMLATTCASSWSAAVYDGTLRLHRGIFSDPRGMETVIRHEAAHAQIAPSVPKAPAWFHEGLAQLLADEDSPGHQRTFRTMIENGTYIPFESIEGSFMVIDDADSARFAYHQSLAMVRALVVRHGDEVLARAVAALQGPEPVALLSELTNPPLTGQDMLTILREQAAATDRGDP